MGHNNENARYGPALRNLGLWILFKIENKGYDSDPEMPSRLFFK